VVPISRSLVATVALVASLDVDTLVVVVALVLMVVMLKCGRLSFSMSFLTRSVRDSIDVDRSLFGGIVNSLDNSGIDDGGGFGSSAACFSPYKNTIAVVYDRWLSNTE